MKSSTYAWIIVLAWLDLMLIRTAMHSHSLIGMWVMSIFPCIWFLIAAYHIDIKDKWFKKALALAERATDSFAKAVNDNLNLRIEMLNYKGARRL